MSVSSSYPGSDAVVKALSGDEAFLERKRRTDVRKTFVREYKNAELVVRSLDQVDVLTDELLPKKTSDDVVRFVCLSDTHWLHDDIPEPIPEADVMIHAGDFTRSGEVESVRDFCDWAGKLIENGTVKTVVLVAGNHETTLDPVHYLEKGGWKRHARDFRFKEDVFAARKAVRNVVFLQDSGVTLEGFKIWGAPWQPEFCEWAFNLPREGEEIESKWALVPEDTDVLVTHGPPSFHGDRIPGRGRNMHYGCSKLLDAVERVQPLVHVFGHIHEGHGVTKQNGTETLFVNAAICNDDYMPVQKPIVFDLPRPSR